MYVCGGGQMVKLIQSRVAEMLDEQSLGLIGNVTLPTEIFTCNLELHCSDTQQKYLRFFRFVFGLSMQAALTLAKYLDGLIVHAL
jgi:hypothetical protein